MNYFKFTIRKCTPVKTLKTFDNTVKQYDYILKTFKHDEQLHIEYHYECVDKKQGYNVHIHGYGKTPNKIPKVPYKKGYNIQILPINDSGADWQRYINKQSTTQEGIRQHIHEALNNNCGSRNEGRDTGDERCEAEEFTDEVPDDIRANVSFRKKLF